MATIPASENVFPEVLLAEVAAPAAAPSGQVRLYVKADGLLYWKDDAGTEYAVGQGDTAGHLADTTDAHDASAVSFDPTGLSEITGTEVQTALEELDAAIGSVSAGSFSGCKAYTTGVSISDAVITFASEVFDTDGYHGATTSRLTVPTTGYYRIEWGGFTSRTDCRIELWKNGANVRGGNRSGASAGNYTHGGDVFDATAGDYFELFADTVAATTFGDNADIGDNFTFSIMRLGA